MDARDGVPDGGGPRLFCGECEDYYRYTLHYKRWRRRLAFKTYRATKFSIAVAASSGASSCTARPARGLCTSTRRVAIVLYRTVCNSIQFNDDGALLRTRMTTGVKTRSGRAQTA